jgi:hypothetical protein
MFGNNEITQFYASFQTHTPANQVFPLQILRPATPITFWTMPLFYTCRNIQT